MEKYEVVKVGEPVELVRCGKYIAASDGKIYNADWRGMGKIVEVKQTKERLGYLSFGFNKKMIKSHRFIAMCFIPNPNNLPEINHKNEIKNDNRVENLEWCDRKYNVNYGTIKEKISNKLKNHPQKSKKVLQFTKDGEFVAEYPSLCEVNRRLGYSFGNISMCCHGKRKTAYDFVWRLEE